MKFNHHSLGILFLVLVHFAWAVTPVSAHALLIRSEPAANAVLLKPPVQVELFFSEALEPGLSSIRVVDTNNLPVDAGDVRVDPADPTRLTVTLHSLPDGVYTVTWKVVSAVDGHQGLGTFPFAVGNANAAAVSAIAQSASFRLPFSTLSSKFLMLASLALLVGGWLFITLLWAPARKAGLDESTAGLAQPPVWDRLQSAALTALLVAIGLGMLAQGGQTAGREVGLPWEPEMGRILLETRLGVLWLARLALAILAVWLSRAPASPWKGWAGFGTYLALLYTLALTSHAATEPRPFLPVLADWLHLLGMTFWFGGLVYFFTAIRHLNQADASLRTRLTSTLASRFSTHALAFVALLGLTGLYSAYLRVGTIQALLETLYGHVLLLKQVFVAALLAIAATNLLVISPRLKRARLEGMPVPGVVERFGKLLIAELTLAGLLLGSVSFLTYIPPAKLASPTADLTGKASVDDLRLQLIISPGRVGQNTFMLQAATSEGHPMHTAKEVLLRFTPVERDIAASELQLIAQGDGTFTGRGAYLSLPGNWRVQAVVRRPDRFDAFADFDFTLQSPGAGNEAARTPRAAGLLLLCVGGVCAMLNLPLRARPRWQTLIGIPAALSIMGLGLYASLRPMPVTVEPSNPIAPDSASIASGQNLYMTRCASCHGTAGKGDGPVGLTLNPRPADLTQHAIPGVHSDAQLFEWITNGFPGSQMPAFKTVLSDTERWHLVNFMRTLAPK